MNKLVIGIPMLAIGFVIYLFSPAYGVGEPGAFIGTIFYGAGQGLVANRIDFKKIEDDAWLGSRDSFIVLLLFPIFLHFPQVGSATAVIWGLAIGLFAASYASQKNESIKE